MNEDLRDRLIRISKEKIPDSDVSHDFEHALRVLTNAENIVTKEGGDMDIIVPAALFHDIIVYPKDLPDSWKKSPEESAKAAENILNSIKEFPKDKINKVRICILECSFSKGIVPELWESKVLQDADRLEATGAISIMRTYASTGQMKRSFYNPEDPFCENRDPEPFKFAIDFFYDRLLKVKDGMHTKTAKNIAKRRTDFLRDFLKELKTELEE